MDPLLATAVGGALVIIFVMAILKYRGNNTVADSPNRPRQGVGRAVAAAGQDRAQLARNQRARMRANNARQQQATQIAEEVEEEPDEETPDTSAKVEFADNMGAKKRAKLEAKMEKKKAREAEEYMREQKKKKDEEVAEERRKIEAKEEEEERLREEAERKAEEERKKREQAEYEAIKAAFVVEGEGFEENEEEDPDSLLRDFINYIQTQKVVLLEDLAAHFKLKTQAVIDRIQDLQTSGELTGVIDDRGKFIYISQSELEDVAKFIKQRGRVSITELAESSNELINLNPVTVL